MNNFEFDEWYEKETLNGWVDKEWMMIAFEAGQQSQQAKVDAALGFTEDVHSENWQEAIHCINSILKGNKDEN